MDDGYVSKAKSFQRCRKVFYLRCSSSFSIEVKLKRERDDWSIVFVRPRLRSVCSLLWKPLASLFALSLRQFEKSLCFVSMMARSWKKTSFRSEYVRRRWNRFRRERAGCQIKFCRLSEDGYFISIDSRLCNTPRRPLA